MSEPTPPATGGGRAQEVWIAAMPWVFVVLWSTGFIGAKFGLPYAEPFTFLAWRFGILTVLLGAVALVMRAPWPGWRQSGRVAVAGLLVHATYLGGVFAAIDHGLPAGVTALVVGLQPLLTAVAAGPLLGERVSGRQWLGFGLGLVGVTLVVARKVSFAAADLTGVGLALLALVGITAGTLYQKRHGGAMDLRTGSAVQFAASAVAMLVLAWGLETMQVEWTGEFVFAMAWLVLVLSVGAISLLFVLIRRGAASTVASLFYLVPPVTSLIAYFMFGETLGWLALAGMVIAVIGVALVVRR